MSPIAAALKHMLAAGMDHVAIVAAVSEMEAAGAGYESPDDRKKRLAKVRTQRWRASQNVTGASQSVTEPSVTERHKTSPRNANASPLAGVVDNLLEVITLDDVAVVGEARRRDADDWPEEKASELLCRAVASPRLDPQKQHGLVTSAGRLAAWRLAGASWTDVVIPVVRALTFKTGQPINSWTYFDKAIAQAVADSRRALPIPDPSHERRNPDKRQAAFADRLQDIDAAMAAAV